MAEGRHRARGANRSLSLDEGHVTEELRLESQPGDLKRSHRRGSMEASRRMGQRCHTWEQKSRTPGVERAGLGHPRKAEVAMPCRRTWSRSRSRERSGTALGWRRSGGPGHASPLYSPRPANAAGPA